MRLRSSLFLPPLSLESRMERAGVRETVVAHCTLSFLRTFSPQPNPLPKGEGIFKSTPPLFFSELAVLFFKTDNSIMWRCSATPVLYL